MTPNANPLSVAVGSLDANKSAELGRNLVAHINSEGQPVLHISLNRLYRSLAAFACDQSRGQTVGTDEMRRLLSTHPLRLANGAVYLGAQAVPFNDQPDPRLAEAVRKWSSDDEIRRLINRAVDDQIIAFDGWVVVSGVGKKDRLYTEHRVTVLARRGSGTVIVKTHRRPGISISTAGYTPVMVSAQVYKAIRQSSGPPGT